MQTTPNLGLKKPESNEYVNVADINENADTIDLAIGEITPLDADMTVYVATTGSDTTGDGTSSNPYETITYALSKVPKFLNGHAASVVIEAGVYLEDIMISGFTGSLQLLIKGNITVNSISVEYSSVLINSSVAAKYTITTQWISIKNRSAYESYTNVDYNIIGSLSGVITDRALSIYAATSSSVYMSGNVYLTENTDTAIGVFSKTIVYVGGLFGSGFTRGSIVDTGSELSIGRNNLLATTDSTLYTASVVVSQFGAKIGTLPYDTTLHVSPTGSDETGTGTSVNPLKTVQRALNLLPKDLGSLTATVIIANGIYDENLDIYGFANGKLLIRSNTASVDNSVTIKSIHAFHCTCDLWIQGVTIVETTSQNAIIVDMVKSLNINYISITSSNLLKTCILAWESIIHVANSRLSNHAHAIYAGENCNIYSNSNTGSGNNVGICSSAGAIICFNGTQPTGIRDTVTATGGVIFQSTGTQISGLITSGLSCTWGTISGGYVRHGNLNGVAMVTINIRVIITSALSSGSVYFIDGFPTTTPVPIALSCNVNGHFKYKVMNTNGRIELTPEMAIPVGNIYQFSATYLTNQ